MAVLEELLPQMNCFYLVIGELRTSIIIVVLHKRCFKYWLHMDSTTIWMCCYISVIENLQVEFWNASFEFLCFLRLNNSFQIELATTLELI